MKAHDISSSTAPAAALPPELIQTGLQKLTQARSASMSVVSEELRTALPAWKATKEPGGSSADVPEWIQTMDREASKADGATCWKTVQAHIARRTAHHVAGMALSDRITGNSLAGFLGIDLEAFALEGWESVTQTGKDIAKERGHV